MADSATTVLLRWQEQEQRTKCDGVALVVLYEMDVRQATTATASLSAILGFLEDITETALLKLAAQKFCSWEECLRYFCNVYKA